MAEARQHLAAGSNLDGRFVVRERLGAGSFGAVYRAEQLVFGKPLRSVALKLFHSSAVNADNVEDIFSDAVTLIGLQETQCPPEVARAIVQVYDIGVLEKPQRQAFMSMRLVPGRRTLKDPVARFRHGGMPMAAAMDFLRKLLVPLAWMHSADPPAVHGDLKPDNVLLTESNELVLTDFGLAARLPLGTLGGEIHYQAFETLTGLPGGAQSDVFGIGLIWYEMLTGRQPFADADLHCGASGEQRALVQAQMEARKWPWRRAQPGEGAGSVGRIAPSSEVNPEMAEHPQLERLLASCLAFRESERPANARVLLGALDRYASTGSLPAWACSAPAPGPTSSAAAATTRGTAPPPAGKTPQALAADSEALLSAGDRIGALRAADSALKLDAGNLPAAFAKARALAAGKQTQEALATLAAVPPQSPGLNEARASVYEAGGLPDVARRLREQAAATRPRR